MAESDSEQLAEQFNATAHLLTPLTELAIQLNIKVGAIGHQIQSDVGQFYWDQIDPDRTQRGSA